MNRTNAARTIFAASLLALHAVTATGATARDTLFHIERNKNANIVVYEARFDANGLLDQREPVAVYWLRLAEQAQIKPLSWVQWKFAFGFRARLGKPRDRATLDMALDLGREIEIRRVGHDYRAMTVIDGADCYLNKLFIQARGKGIRTRVDFFEFHGESPQNNQRCYERYVP